MRASRERERERACERVSELARSLAKNLKSSSSRSLARLKIEVAQLALARSRKFSPIFCTLVQPAGYWWKWLSSRHPERRRKKKLIFTEPPKNCEGLEYSLYGAEDEK
jgi:hypothetical protein